MFFFSLYETEESARKQYISRLFQRRQNRLENNNSCVITLFQRQKLENIFPAQWKTEFQSYFSQKLLESARKKKKKKTKKKKKKIYKVFPPPQRL